ncbi:MAG: ACP S-malonyltransferase [Microbacterium sp.]|uniref:ACP S-malonyltransferase n=1 Tax=Microbacterium sp. TaxID=51671 RepID=UPI003A89C129
MIVVVCPGQGSQTPGFLAPWLELDGMRERLEKYSDAAGVDVIEHGVHSDAALIRDTSIAQPLIVAASLTTWHALTDLVPKGAIGGVAGHSVGELAALPAAGVLTDDAAMRLVGVRGRAMAHAAAFEMTGMSAIVGGVEAEVIACIDDLALTAANRNGAGQIVAAGGLGQLDRLQKHPPAGARVIPLPVAGAFHTVYMHSAVDKLTHAAADVDVADPQLTLWTNHDGSVVTTGREAIDLLVGQVASPVRWDLCMESFAAHAVTGIVELAPAGTLVGLAKRALKGVPTVAVKTPDDLQKAVALITGGHA